MSSFCPICVRKVNATICACGYDITKAYDCGKTLVMIPKGLMSTYQKRRDYEKKHLVFGSIQDNYERMLKKADSGDIKSQYELGQAYYIFENYDKALYWCQKAAESGNADAMNLVGEMCCHGWGVSRNEQEGYIWYKKAAENGNAAAMVKIGKESGYKDAMMWYQKAVGLGNNDALNEIGDLYLYGHGVEENWEEAFKWYQKAIISGGEKKAYKIGRYLKNEGEALKWFDRAAKLGDDQAVFEIGRIYARGRVVEKDEDAAKEMFIKAAELGNADAIKLLKSDYGIIV